MLRVMCEEIMQEDGCRYVMQALCMQISLSVQVS